MPGLLWRHKQFLAFAMLSGIAVSAIYLTLVTPRYTAEAVVRIVPAKAIAVAQPGANDSDVIIREVSYDEQLKQLQSRNIADKAVTVVQPEVWPEYASLFRSGNSYASATTVVEGLRQPTPINGAGATRANPGPVIDRFLPIRERKWRP